MAPTTPTTPNIAGQAITMRAQAAAADPRRRRAPYSGAGAGPTPSFSATPAA